MVDDNVRRYALIKDGIVENVILARDSWTPPSGIERVDVTDISVGPGFTYDGESFTDPRLEEEENGTDEG